MQSVTAFQTAGKASLNQRKTTMENQSPMSVPLSKTSENASVKLNTTKATSNFQSQEELRRQQSREDRWEAAKIPRRHRMNMKVLQGYPRSTEEEILKTVNRAGIAVILSPRGTGKTQLAVNAIR